MASMNTLECTEKLFTFAHTYICMHVTEANKKNCVTPRSILWFCINKKCVIAPTVLPKPLAHEHKQHSMNFDNDK